MTLEIKTAPVLASWKESMFSHEWLTPEGQIKAIKDMSEKLREKRLAMEAIINNKDNLLERPVLGIGILDNVEIGSGRDLFLCLAARGEKFIPVHIPRSHEADFRIFIR